MTLLRDVMSSSVASTAPDASVAEAAAVMVKGRFGSVVVLHGTMLVGIFTERDVLRAVAEGVDVNVATVESWMTAEPATAGPDEDTDHATETMLSMGFRHLPVVDGDDQLVGIVSLRDVLSARIGRR